MNFCTGKVEEQQKLQFQPTLQLFRCKILRNMHPHDPNFFRTSTEVFKHTQPKGYVIIMCLKVSVIKNVPDPPLTTRFGARLFKSFKKLYQIKSYARLKFQPLTVSHLCPGFSYVTGSFSYLYDLVGLTWVLTKIRICTCRICLYGHGNTTIQF